MGSMQCLTHYTAVFKDTGGIIASPAVVIVSSCDFGEIFLVHSLLLSFFLSFLFICIFCLSICFLLQHGFGRSYASWHPHGHHGIVYVQSKVQPSRTSLTGPMCKVMGCKGTSHSLDVFKTET